jgi:hypothetical protein
MARDVDYRGTDGCYLARSCQNGVCLGKLCNDYGETKQHRKRREAEERREANEGPANIGRD